LLKQGKKHFCRSFASDNLASYRLFEKSLFGKEANKTKIDLYGGEAEANG
jgi:hypothetical protein